jgi:hypothetical protein
MNKRDLVYFEQILPKLQPNLKTEAIKSQSHKADINSQER